MAASGDLSSQTTAAATEAEKSSEAGSSEAAKRRCSEAEKALPSDWYITWVNRLREMP